MSKEEMKKTYIVPLTEIVVVRTSSMMDGDGTGTIKPDPYPSTWSTNDDVDARQFNFDEDEQNEDFFRRYNPWE